MPTASTSQIFGNNECFEPYTSNIYVRRVLCGEFVVVNPHLLQDLSTVKAWCVSVKNSLVFLNGSVLQTKLPWLIKATYKTVWEIKQRCVISHAAERGIYVDQSQSLNVHMEVPNFSKVTSLHFLSWKLGLKTGMYYLRSCGATDPVKVTLQPRSNTGSLDIN